MRLWVCPFFCLCVSCATLSLIPKGTENLRIGQGGSTIFLSCTSDSVREHGPSAGRKKRGKAGTVQNQVFSSLGYTADEERPAPTASSLARGKKLFLDHCAQCHGKDGTGNGPLARALPNVPNLTLPTTQQQSDQYLFDQVTNPKPPMPSFKSLSAEDRWDLVDYVRELGKSE